MTGDAQTGKDFSFLEGFKGGFHKLSHHREKREVRDQYERICTWHMEQAAHFFERLQGLDEGPSNLLDNCQILYGSSIKEDNKHTEQDLPLLPVGGAAGSVRCGRVLRAPKETPLCNLYVSMLRRMGIPTDAFGDSSNSLDELLG